MEDKYIYGIIAGENETTLDISGLGGSGRVYTIVHRDISCALSDYSGTEFGSLSKEEVIQYLLAHQVVVEHIMREHTLLPIKFGTILAGSEEVCGLLSQGHQQFVAALAWFRDKVEIEVAATWDTARVLKEVAAEPAIARTREAISSQPGQRTLEEAIRLGQMVKAALDERRNRYRERMMDFLKPVAVDMLPNALVSDEMVMNVAFLVEKSSQEEFDKRVSHLNDLFLNQIDFRIIGPLPPYSFATVEVTKPSPEKIEEARQLLHLDTAISEPEVKRAYRRLAAKTHPDYNPGDELAKTRFAQLRQASELLIAYSRGQAGGNGSLLINIRRQRTELQHLHFGPVPSFG